MLDLASCYATVTPNVIDCSSNAQTTQVAWEHLWEIQPQDPADACAADDLQSKQCYAVPKCLKQHEKDQPCSCWAAKLQSQEPVSCNAQMPHAM